MADFPHSLSEFEQWFGDEAACAEYLAAARWPDGFVCPGCSGNKAWQLDSKPWIYECARCGRQTSVSAGTIMHQSKLPLTTWFWAAYVMATQPGGISALQLQRELELGSYKTAWFLCAKLRRSMVESGRPLLSGLVEIGETEITYRGKSDAATRGRGGSNQGKMLVVGGVEVHELGPGYIRLSTFPDYSTESLHAFLAASLAPGVTARTSGDFGYCGAPAVNNEPLVIGVRATPWIHRIFFDLEVWALGAYHGLRPGYLQSYLDEFAFRFNTRRNRDAAFPSLLGIATAHRPLTYNMLVSRGSA